MSDIELFRKKNISFKIQDLIQGDDGKTYIVGDRISAGGNAVVHECIEKLSGDSFAVKFQLEFKDRRRERFQREIDLLREFNDPHIIKFVASGSITGIQFFTQFQGTRPIKRESGKQKDIPFVILEKASEDLGNLAKFPHQINAATYLAQFLGLAKALVKVNQKALHRDIKPENILVVGDAWAISDFGLCALNEDGRDLSGDNEKIGPALWMSPEAFNKKLGCNDAISQTSDVFQLASVFWYAACGRHPTGIVKDSDWRGPTELFPIIEKALLHNRQERYQTSAEFNSALEEAIIR